MRHIVSKAPAITSDFWPPRSDASDGGPLRKIGIMARRLLAISGNQGNQRAKSHENGPLAIGPLVHIAITAPGIASDFRGPRNVAAPWANSGARTNRSILAGRPRGRIAGPLPNSVIRPRTSLAARSQSLEIRIFRPHWAPLGFQRP